MRPKPVKEYRRKLSAVLALVLSAGVAVLIPAPSLAHTVNTACWSVDLSTEAAPPGVS